MAYGLAMKMREYLDWKGLKPYQFARVAKVRPGTIYQLAKDNGDKPILMTTTVNKIVAASGGHVTAKELL